MTDFSREYFAVITFSITQADILCCVRHGRDNKIHYFLTPIVPPSITRTPATNVPSPKAPTPLVPEWSMDVNAMAFSKMSILRLSDGTALIAVPALTKDEMVSVHN